MFGRKRNHSYLANNPYGMEYPQRVPLRNHDHSVRQQPYPFLYPLPSGQGNPNWYQNQFLYPQVPANFYPYSQGNYLNGAMSVGQSSAMNHQYSQNVFQNPLQPNEDLQPSVYPNQYSNSANFNPNPYPNQKFMPKQPTGIQSMMNSFKAQDGSVDINKMVNTAGQMMNAVSQVSSMVKGLGGVFKV